MCDSRDVYSDSHEEQKCIFARGNFSSFSWAGVLTSESGILVQASLVASLGQVS